MNKVDVEIIKSLEEEIHKLEVHLSELMENQYSVMKAIRYNIREKKGVIRQIKARKGGG